MILLAGWALCVTPLIQDGACPSEINLAFPGYGPLVSADHRVVFSVSEKSVGRDLDGDGSVQGKVLHLYDSELRKTQNLGLQGEDTVLLGDLLVTRWFGVVALELSSMTQSVYDVDGNFPGFIVGGTSVAVMTNEWSTGADMNADGDLLDGFPTVLFRDGSVGEYPWAGIGYPLAGQLLTIAVPENSQGGVDVNGDGDLWDWILRIVDTVSGESISTAMDAFAMDASEDAILIAVNEPYQSQDLNGDGDQFDRVAHVIDRSNGCIQNLGHSTYRGVVIGRSMAFQALEDAQDINGDGDQTDIILLYFEDFNRPPTLVASVNAELVASDERLIFRREEDGHVDLNGDGDMEDFVLASFELDRCELVNFGIATENPIDGAVDGRGGLFSITEVVNGIDLNGDGDLGDRVVHYVDFESASVVNLGLAHDKGGLHFEGRWGSFWMSEEDQGDRDQNGDGDTADVLACLYDSLTGKVCVYPQGVHEPQGMTLSSGILAYWAGEWSSGMDFDGDGDIRDLVLFVVLLPDAAPLRD